MVREERGRFFLSRTHNPFVYKLITSVELTRLHPPMYKATMECGHSEFMYNCPGTSIRLMFFSKPELRDKALLGCWECGKAELKRREGG